MTYFHSEAKETYISLQGPPVFSLVCFPECAILIGTSEYTMKSVLEGGYNNDANEPNVAYIVESRCMLE